MIQAKKVWYEPLLRFAVKHDKGTLVVPETVAEAKKLGVQWRKGARMKDFEAAWLIFKIKTKEISMASWMGL